MANKNEINVLPGDKASGFRLPVGAQGASERLHNCCMTTCCSVSIPTKMSYHQLVQPVLHFLCPSSSSLKICRYLPLVLSYFAAPSY
jgi:hypothetical protein